MDQEQIKTLFELFYGETGSGEIYSAVLTGAEQEVRRQLKADADTTDTRLNYLTAAVAFLRVTEITAARDRAACTIAGTIAQNTDAAQKLAFAKQLTAAYRILCLDLLTDEAFLFCAVGERGLEQDDASNSA